MGEKNDPYIVIGTGRSGSSTVARVLHKMGIFMGHEFREPNEINPDGFWEDAEFYRPNYDFLHGKTTYPEWIDKIFGVIAKRMELNRPWGFKDPDATHFLGLYLSFFENPKIIRCKRDKGLTVKSLMKSFGHTKEYAENLYKQKEWMLDNILSEKDFLTVHFGVDRIADGEIIDLIESKWGKNEYKT